MSAAAARKYRVLFKPFFDAIIAELAHHDAEKRDSWMGMPETELLQLLADCYGGDRTNDDNVDMAALEGMLWLRNHYKEKGIW